MINTPSVLIGYPLLGALGQAAKANRSVMIAGLLQIVLLGVCFTLGWTQALQIAITVLVVEAIVLMLRAKWGQEEYRLWQAERRST
jgi:PST family polysaccharide transporter